MNTKKIHHLGFVIAVGIFTLTLSGARAQWTGDAGDLLFNNPANWVGGVINGQFTYSATTANTLNSVVFAQGSTTLYTGTFDARQLLVGASISGSGIAAGTIITAINSGGQITLSQPTTGASASGGAYAVTGFNTIDTTGGNNRLEIQSTGAAAAFNPAVTLDHFTMLRVGSVAGWLQSNDHTGVLNFNPNATVNIASSTAGDMGYTITNSARIIKMNFLGDVTFNIGHASVSNRLTVELGGRPINIAGALTKNGPGMLSLGSTADALLTMSGAVTVNGGMFKLATGGQALAKERVTGATKYDLINRNSALFLDVSNVSASQVAGVNLIENVPVNLYSGALAVSGNGASNLPSQTVSTLTLNGGRNALGLVNTTSNNFSLIVNTLTRRNDATLNLFGLGSSGKLIVTNDQWIKDELVGGILPWASTNMWSPTADGYDSLKSYGIYQGNSLVTYNSTDGFRALNEYYQGLAGASITDNVMLDASDLINGGTVNSLSMKNGVTLTTQVEHLFINSGVLVNTDRSQITIRGVIDTGTRALIVYGHDGTNHLDAEITNQVAAGQYGLILAHVGLDVLYKENTYGGNTLVQGGVRLDTAKAIPLTSHVRVDNGGSILVNANHAQAASLAGTGSVSFNNATRSLSLGGDGNNSADPDGKITIHSGGFIAPGDPDGLLEAGTLYLGSNILGVNFLAGSMLKMDLASDTQSDLLSAFNTSAPVLSFASGASLQLNLLNGYTPTEGSTWLLTAGFADVLGFDNLSLIDSGGNDLSELFQLSLVSNNLFLTAIPEPSAWMLLLGGATLLALTLNRRRA